MTIAASIPYRDDDRDLSADVAKRRAVQLRAELVTVVRLARVMAHDVLSAQAMLTSERRGDKGAHGFVRWWWRSQWLLTWHQRGDVAEAEAHVSIVAELAGIATNRVGMLRERIAAADVASAGATASDDEFDDALDAAVDRAGIIDTLELAVALRRAIDGADMAADTAQRRARVKDSSYLRALRDLAHARVHLELVLASLIALRGADDSTVVRFAAITRELRTAPEAPDAQWRDQVGIDRDRVAALLGELDDQLSR